MPVYIQLVEESVSDFQLLFGRLCSIIGPHSLHDRTVPRQGRSTHQLNGIMLTLRSTRSWGLHHSWSVQIFSGGYFLFPPWLSPCLVIANGAAQGDSHIHRVTVVLQFQSVPLNFQLAMWPVVTEMEIIYLCFCGGGIEGFLFVGFFKSFQGSFQSLINYFSHWTVW